MKKIQIKLENTIDIIPSIVRKKKIKYFEFKFLFIRLTLENVT